jgi:hypothetical protein
MSKPLAYNFNVGNHKTQKKRRKMAFGELFGRHISGGKVILALTWLASSAFSGNEVFSHSAFVQLPTITQEELVEVLLPQAVYAIAGETLADVRFLRSDRVTPIPFLLEGVTKKRRVLLRETRTLRLQSVEERENQRLQVVLCREEPREEGLLPLSGLDIHTPLRDFERKIRVEASDDGTNWKTVVESARIFDVSTFADFRVKEIALPWVTQRYLRLTVDQMFSQATSRSSTVTTSEDKDGNLKNIDRKFVEEKRPFRIERVNGWIEKESWLTDARPLVKRQFKVAEGEKDTVLQRRFPKASLLFFDTGRAPLERVTLNSSSRIFRVECQLLAERDSPSPGETEWVRLVSSSVFRLAFRDYLKEELTLTFSESRAMRYCLVIPEQTEVADLSIASCEGPEYRAVFPCSVGDAFVLVCGNPKLRGSTGHNAGHVRALLSRGITPVRAEVGPLTQDGKMHEGRGINTTWILTLAVGLAAAVLGLAVAVALKRMPVEQ